MLYLLNGLRNRFPDVYEREKKKFLSRRAAEARRSFLNIENPMKFLAFIASTCFARRNAASWLWTSYSSRTCSWAHRLTFQVWN
jgi:hypothetical protein